MARRRQSGRGRPPARSTLPPWVPVLMVGFPLVAILAALVLRGTMSQPVEEGEAEGPVAEDPNQEIQQLAAEVPELEREGRAVMNALRGDVTPAVKVRAQRVQERIQAWMDRWDRYFEPLRDEEGQLPPEYQGYGPIRAKVNQLRVDLLKTGSF